MKIQLKRSNQLDSGSAKEPTVAQMEYGELAVNYNADDPVIFIKDSDDNIIRIAGTNALGNIEIPSEGADPHQPGTLDDRYVEITGDNMTGDLTFNTDNIVFDASTGSGTFAGKVDAAGLRSETTVAEGTSLNVIRKTSNASDSLATFKSDFGGDSATVVTMFSDGAADFSAGNVRISAGTNGAGKLEVYRSDAPSDNSSPRDVMYGGIARDDIRYYLTSDGSLYLSDENMSNYNAAKTAIHGDGSAEFAGIVTVGGDAQSAEVGVKLRDDIGFAMACAPANGVAFGVYEEGDTNRNCNIYSDGRATFASLLSVNTEGKRDTSIFAGYSSAKEVTSIINHDGSATFAGTVTADSFVVTGGDGGGDGDAGDLHVTGDLTVDGTSTFGDELTGPRINLKASDGATNVFATYIDDLTTGIWNAAGDLRLGNLSGGGNININGSDGSAEFASDIAVGGTHTNIKRTSASGSLPAVTVVADHNNQEVGESINIIVGGPKNVNSSPTGTRGAIGVQVNGSFSTNYVSGDRYCYGFKSNLGLAANGNSLNFFAEGTAPSFFQGDIYVGPDKDDLTTIDNVRIDAGGSITVGKVTQTGRLVVGNDDVSFKDEVIQAYTWVDENTESGSYQLSTNEQHNARLFLARSSTSPFAASSSAAFVTTNWLDADNSEDTIKLWYDGSATFAAGIVTASLSAQATTNDTWFRTGSNLDGKDYIWAGKDNTSNIWNSGVKKDGTFVLGNLNNSTYNVEISADGSASFAGQISSDTDGTYNFLALSSGTAYGAFYAADQTLKMGNLAASDYKITLDATDGSAQFTGKVDSVGLRSQTSVAEGVTLNVIRNSSNASDTLATFKSDFGGASSTVVSVKCDGSADFSGGNVRISAGTSGEGKLEVYRTGANPDNSSPRDVFYLGIDPSEVRTILQTDGSLYLSDEHISSVDDAKARIKGDGNVEFDGTVTANGTILTRAGGVTLDVGDRLEKTQAALTALKTAAEDNATDLAGLKAAIVAALANI